jgi:diguanylate cyclase (GGDEF)-like protein
MHVALADPDDARASGSSWLCRDEFDRQRMLDMEERVRPVRRRAAGIMVMAILGLSPWLGWWPLLFVVSIMGCFTAADLLMPRLGRPEYLMFAAWLASGISIALAVALSGGPGIAALSWLAVPVITLSSRFSMRGVVVGVCVSLVLALAVAFAVDAHAIFDNPTLVVVPVVLILCVAVLSTPLMRSDIQHRSDSVIDQLTGMLNRKALSVRAQELEEQSALTGEPIGVIVGDLDHFKQVNDTHGHGVGDAVLREVAYLLRKQLRAFDLAYRLGGEEFLILLPGAELDATTELAERLRAAVSEQSLSVGVHVTMSFGLGVSPRGAYFDYETAFAEADAALYEAKRAGRDRVHQAASGLIAVVA